MEVDLSENQAARFAVMQYVAMLRRLPEASQMEKFNQNDAIVVGGVGTIPFPNAEHYVQQRELSIAYNPRAGMGPPPSQSNQSPASKGANNRFPSSSGAAAAEKKALLPTWIPAEKRPTITQLDLLLQTVGASAVDCVTTNDYAVRLYQCLDRHFDLSAEISGAVTKVRRPFGVAFTGSLTEPVVRGKLKEKLGAMDGSATSLSDAQKKLTKMEDRLRDMSETIERLRSVKSDVGMLHDRARLLRETCAQLKQTCRFQLLDMQDYISDQTNRLRTLVGSDALRTTGVGGGINAAKKAALEDEIRAMKEQNPLRDPASVLRITLESTIDEMRKVLRAPMDANKPVEDTDDEDSGPGGKKKKGGGAGAGAGAGAAGAAPRRIKPNCGEQYLRQEIRLPKGELTAAGWDTLKPYDKPGVELDLLKEVRNNVKLLLQLQKLMSQWHMDHGQSANTINGLRRDVETLTTQLAAAKDEIALLESAKPAKPQPQEGGSKGGSKKQPPPTTATAPSAGSSTNAKQSQELTASSSAKEGKDKDATSKTSGKSKASAQAAGSSPPPKAPKAASKGGVTTAASSVTTPPLGAASEPASPIDLTTGSILSYCDDSITSPVTIPGASMVGTIPGASMVGGGDETAAAVIDFPLARDMSSTMNPQDSNHANASSPIIPPTVGENPSPRGGGSVPETPTGGPHLFHSPTSSNLPPLTSTLDSIAGSIHATKSVSHEENSGAQGANKAGPKPNRGDTGNKKPSPTSAAAKLPPRTQSIRKSAPPPDAKAVVSNQVSNTTTPRTEDVRSNTSQQAISPRPMDAEVSSNSSHSASHAPTLSQERILHIHGLFVELVGRGIPARLHGVIVDLFSVLFPNDPRLLLIKNAAISDAHEEAVASISRALVTPRTSNFTADQTNPAETLESDQTVDASQQANTHQQQQQPKRRASLRYGAPPASSQQVSGGSSEVPSPRVPPESTPTTEQPVAPAPGKLRVAPDASTTSASAEAQRAAPKSMVEPTRQDSRVGDALVPTALPTSFKAKSSQDPDEGEEVTPGGAMQAVVLPEDLIAAAMRYRTSVAGTSLSTKAPLGGSHPLAQIRELRRALGPKALRGDPEPRVEEDPAFEKRKDKFVELTRKLLSDLPILKKSENAPLLPFQCTPPLLFAPPKPFS